MPIQKPKPNNSQLIKLDAEDRTVARQLVIFLLFGFLFLFYPGDSFYIELLAYNRSALIQKQSVISYKPKPVPYLLTTTLPLFDAGGLYVIDLDSATPVLEKNINKQFLPASTVKIITALTAADYFQPGDILKVKRFIDEGQVVGFYVGDKITFENLIYALLIHSGNDAAFIIADNYPGGERAFVKQMNQKAAQLQMNNSKFVNPAGLDDFGQHTTPFDLSLAARKLLQNPLLAKTVSIKNITITDTEFNHFYPLANVNQLLGLVPGVGGLKTGYTEDAGENLVTFYKKNGRQYLIILLKSKNRFLDTENIIDWININIDYITI